ncbi:MAG: hypothetical protein Q4E17_03400 [Synergistes sp.]|nr:hypothetical protein [Synergistes sp.]
MKKRIFSVLNLTAKYMFIACIIASLVFCGWRIATKSAYVEHEKKQCSLLAISSVLVAADALGENRALAEYAVSKTKLTFITDHKKFPGNYNITLTFVSDDGGIKIRSEVKSGWNTRSPQSDSFELLRLSDGSISFYGSDDLRAAQIQKETEHNAASGTSLHIFTFPFDKPCPIQFTAESKNISGPDEKPLYILKKH